MQQEIRRSCGDVDDYVDEIANIRTISSTRSNYACLEAVTTKGMRVFFTASKMPLQTCLFEQEKARSETLKVIHIRWPSNKLIERNKVYYVSGGPGT